jgi:hypothetical protein
VAAVWSAFAVHLLCRARRVTPRRDQRRAVLRSGREDGRRGWEPKNTTASSRGRWLRTASRSR